MGQRRLLFGRISDTDKPRTTSIPQVWLTYLVIVCVSDINLEFALCCFLCGLLCFAALTATHVKPDALARYLVCYKNVGRMLGQCQQRCTIISPASVQSVFIEPPLSCAWEYNCRWSQYSPSHPLPCHTCSSIWHGRGGCRGRGYIAPSDQ